MIKFEKQNSKYDWHVAFVKLGFFVGILFLIVFRSAQAQDYPYIENQDQHSFAQLYFGFDQLRFSSPVKTQYLDNTGTLKEIKFELEPQYRFLIGGTHFWGHADFYVAFPFSRKHNKEGLEINHNNGVETGFRVYPFRI